MILNMVDARRLGRPCLPLRIPKPLLAGSAWCDMAFSLQPGNEGVAQLIVTN